jgi:uncharacterized protein YdeI (YjbR/CyaY-like superfamily)
MRPANSKTFRASLEPLRSNRLKWTIARLPFSVERIWKTRGIMKVHVTINGLEYRTSLFPTRKGEHFLLVNKKMQKAARIAPGSVATFTVRPDLSPRELELPRELEDALDEDKALRKWFDRLSYSIRKWLSDLVAGSKSADTRRKRADRVAEQVMEAMEAEHDLPPMIRLTFARHPGAEQAWKKMTPIQRRNGLLAVFYYRTPESRMRRLERLIEQALTRTQSATAEAMPDMQ